MNKTHSPKVYILILNWNGWQDTINCLKSIYSNSYENYHIVLCDNNSKDNSIQKITSYLKKNKSINLLKYNKDEATKGGNQKLNPSIVMIDTGANLGFAGGNNIGLKYILKKNDFKYIWLLNNDTIIAKNSLIELIKKCEGDEKIGICGSTLIHMDKKKLIQACGGAKYNKYFGMQKSLYRNKIYDKNLNEYKIEKEIDYVSGASMFISKKFIKKIGMLNEKFFLYFEEIDWCIRSKSLFKIGYASKSLVFHKEGSSIGKSTSKSYQKRYQSEFFLARNKILFTKIYFPYFLPTVYMSFIIILIKRLLFLEWSRSLLLTKVLIENKLFIKYVF